MTPEIITSFGQLFTMPYLFEILAVALVMGAIYLLALSSHFQVMQQSSYRVRAFLRVAVTGKTRAKDRLRLVTTLGFLTFLLFNFAFSFWKHNAVSFIGFAPTLGFFVWFIALEGRREKKVSLKNTPRMIRLKILTAVLTFALTFALAVGGNAVAYAVKDGSVSIARYFPVVLLPYGLPFVLCLANTLLLPIEKLLARQFIVRAKVAIKNSNAVVVGVTGSYGKTSVKNALAVMLGKKFRVLATPASYNTPLGISRAVEGGLGGVQIFIAEMGARKAGDVAELCSMTCPTVGVVTAVGKQHLQSFGSVENVQKAKGELPASLPQNGFAVFGEDQGCRALYEACAVKKAYAPQIKDVKVGAESTTFTLCLASGEVACSTTLLGSHNLQNLALAAAVCEYFGMEGWEIAAGISAVSAPEHRLQRLQGASGVVIDDSYNSNPVGAKCAVEALLGFDGRKIVVTPGFVELGREEDAENYQLGKTLSVVDKVYAVGLLRTKPIVQGLLDAGYDKKNIVVVASLEEAKEKMQKDAQDGDVTMFLNDLPDQYDE